MHKNASSLFLNHYIFHRHKQISNKLIYLVVKYEQNALKLDQCKPEAGWLAGWLGLRPGWLGLRPGWLGLRPGWLGLRPGWMAQRGGTDGRTYVRTDVRTYVQNLPILQDFVPYRGRCPASQRKF